MAHIIWVIWYRPISFHIWLYEIDLPSKLGSKQESSEASVIFSWNSFKYSKSISATLLEHSWHSDSLSVSKTYGEHDWPHDWPADDDVILVSPIGVIPLNRDYQIIARSDSVRWFLGLEIDGSIRLFHRRVTATLQQYKKTHEISHRFKILHHTHVFWWRSDHLGITMTIRDNPLNLREVRLHWFCCRSQKQKQLSMILSMHLLLLERFLDRLIDHR